MSNKIIKINRGDSFELPIKLFNSNDASGKHVLVSNEVVYFALLLPHQKFEDAILIKGYTVEDQDTETGEILIKIMPNDTKYLAPGVYYYTIKLQCGGTMESVDDFDEPDDVHTVVERTKFIINE